MDLNIQTTSLRKESCQFVLQPQDSLPVENDQEKCGDDEEDGLVLKRSVGFLRTSRSDGQLSTTDSWERSRKDSDFRMDTASCVSEHSGRRYSLFSKSNNAKQALISALSALYAMLLIILSLGFEISIVVVESVNAYNYDFFYIYLYGVALLFLLYCYAFLLKNDDNAFLPNVLSYLRLARARARASKESRNGDSPAVDNVFTESLKLRRNMILSLKRKITHSAKGAGSLYLRLGCVVFGVIGLISKGLTIFSAFDSHDYWCIHASTIAETALGGIFIFVQMFFVFENSKLVIHRFRSVAKIGMMHLIATNLCLWIRSLVEEQYAIMKEFNESLHESKEHHPNSSTSINMVASMITDSHSIGLGHPSDALLDALEKHTSTCPPVMGYGQHRYIGGVLVQDVQPFMTTCIIEYSLICSAVVYILWRHIGSVPKLKVRQRKQRFHVDCSSSTKGLFVGLLFMVFTIISMLIFFTKLRKKHNVEALWIFYASDAFLYVVSIAALTIATSRVKKLYYMPIQHDIVLLDDILLVVGLVGQLMFCVFSVVPLHSGSVTAALLVVTSILRMIEVLLQTVFIFFGQRLATLYTSGMADQKPGRELVTFLLLTNLSMFLINTFETQKAGSNPLMSEFYGRGIWTVIVHSTTPLSIFYRFHSTVCLAEIWKSAYRVKEGGSLFPL